MRLLVLRFFSWYVLVLAIPLFTWLARRFPIASHRWRRGVAVHLAVVTVMALVTNLVWTFLAGRWLGTVPGFSLGEFFAASYLRESVPAWGVVAVIHALEFNRRARAHELESARLQAQLAESRLDALFAQLHPHFLFNTLQGISTLMHRDVAAADRVLSHLSDLLRRALQRGDRQEVPLREELDVLQHYVAIARSRFKGDLTFTTSVSEAALDAAVPFFVLQPLVENAVEHGVARGTGGGSITVAALVSDGRLQLEVSDDGPGMTGEPDDEGIGLSNTRQRLQQLYGDAQTMTLEPSGDGGLCVRLDIPYRANATPFGPEHG